MIWLRRFFGTPIFLLLVVVLQATIFTNQFTVRLLNPSYYLEIISSGDLYNFVLNDVPQSALEEGRPQESNKTQDPILILSKNLSNDEIIESLNRVIPADWLQSSTESSFTELGTYFVGQSNSFLIEIPLDERIESASLEISQIIKNAEIYDWIFETQIRPQLKGISESELPLEIKITEDSLIESAQNVITEKWIVNQIDSALFEITPYIVGRTDTFTIKINTQELSQSAITETKNILSQGDAYNSIFDNVATPAISSAIKNIPDLPYNISLTEEQLISTLKSSASPEWIQATTESVIDDVALYILGSTDEFNIEVKLDQVKKNSIEGISILIQEKLKERFDSLNPILKETIDTEEITQNVMSQIEPLILSNIPDSINFDEETLISISPDAMDQLQIIREVMKNGYLFSESDFEKILLNSGNLQQFEEIRNYLTGGFKFSDDDYKRILTSQPQGKTLHDNIESIRSLLALSGVFQILLYIVPILIALVFGFLGAKRFINKIIWASSSLLIASIIIFAIWNFIFPIYAYPIIESQITLAITQLITEGTPYFSTQLLVGERLDFVAKWVIEDLINGFVSMSLIYGIGSGFVLGICIVNKFLRSLQKNSRDITEKQKEELVNSFFDLKQD
tara:strand:- start:15970 stop:17850 length:1881 start_codon:yes stop_codon:yes gene_type:complete